MNNRILVIDDDADCREVMNEALSYCGFEVLAVDGDIDIFNLLNKFKPNLLLIDFLLNGINGGDVCSRIKKDSIWSCLPVIIVSAYPKVINSQVVYGCDHFLAKPFDLNELIDKVTEYCAKTKFF